MNQSVPLDFLLFNAAAATVPHLGAKLASAFGAALATSDEQRKQMISDALSKRFSLDVQMEAYKQLWHRVSSCSCHIKCSCCLFHVVVAHLKVWMSNENCQHNTSSALQGHIKFSQRCQDSHH